MSYINLLDIIYPVGSIYFSNEDTSPSEIIGGIWYKLEPQKYLMSAGNDIVLPDSMGGANAVTLTVEQMPSHMHAQNGWSYNVGTNGYWVLGGTKALNAQTYYTGGSKPHTNMPAYYATNIWIRIS